MINRKGSWSVDDIVRFEASTVTNKDDGRVRYTAQILDGDKAQAILYEHRMMTVVMGYLNAISESARVVGVTFSEMTSTMTTSWTELYLVVEALLFKKLGYLPRGQLKVRSLAGITAISPVGIGGPHRLRIAENWELHTPRVRVLSHQTFGESRPVPSSFGMPYSSLTLEGVPNRKLPDVLIERVKTARTLAQLRGSRVNPHYVWLVDQDRL